MKNIKTTVSGLVAAGAAFIVANPAMFVKYPVVVTVAGFVMAGGLAGIGIFGRDASTHSTMDEVVQATKEKQAADIKAVQ